jgi:hypothetical protein
MDRYIPMDGDTAITFVLRPTGTGTFDLIVSDTDYYSAYKPSESGMLVHGLENLEVHRDCSPGLADALLTLQVHIQDRLRELVQVDSVKNARIKVALRKLWYALRTASDGATDWRKTHDLKNYIRSQIKRYEAQSQKNLDPGKNQ